MPTAVPPPISAIAGTLGVRHVFCLIGLPERGKPFIARRLEAYLSFFHGAEVMLFDLSAYQARYRRDLAEISPRYRRGDSTYTPGAHWLP